MRRHLLPGMVLRLDYLDASETSLASRSLPAGKAIGSVKTFMSSYQVQALWRDIFLCKHKIAFEIESSRMFQVSALIS